YETRIGRAPLRRNNPLRRIAGLDILSCAGSDGMPYGRLYGIDWGDNGYFEDQRLAPEDACRAYSASGAYASFEEDRKGTLETGKVADFVILDGIPFRDPDRIRECKVRETWIVVQRAFASSS